MYSNGIFTVLHFICIQNTRLYKIYPDKNKISTETRVPPHALVTERKFIVKKCNEKLNRKKTVRVRAARTEMYLFNKKYISGTKGKERSI